MDKSVRVQLEEIARQGHYLSKWLEESGAFDLPALAYPGVSDAIAQAMDSIALSSQIMVVEAALNLQTEALKGINLEPFRGMNLDLFRGMNLEPFRGLALDAVFRQWEPAVEVTAAIIRDALSTPIDGILRYESTLGELSGSLIGLHRVFEGVGTSFTIALDTEAIDERTTYRGSFELAAGTYGAHASNLQVDTKTEVDTAAFAKDKSELNDTPPAQIIRLNTLEANISLGPLQVVSTSQSWSYTRSENAEGLHQFNFCGMGGDAMRRKVNFITELTCWAMSRGESEIERIVSTLFIKSDTAADLTPIEVDPMALGIRAKQLGIRPGRLVRWDKIRLHYLPKGLTQAQIAEEEGVSTQAIKKDFHAMRQARLLPQVDAKPTP